MVSYSGPVRPGTSEETFRETGKTERLYRGPVRPGTDEGTFRDTGERVKKGSGGRSGGEDSEGC